MSPINKDDFQEGRENILNKVGDALHKAAQAVDAAAAKGKAIAQHKVVADETLSHIALKYYGNAAEPYWRHIYNANKATIGDNPGILRPGMVLDIPEKPVI